MDSRCLVRSDISKIRLYRCPCIRLHVLFRHPRKLGSLKAPCPSFLPGSALQCLYLTRLQGLWHDVLYGLPFRLLHFPLSLVQRLVLHWFADVDTSTVFWGLILAAPQEAGVVDIDAQCQELWRIFISEILSSGLWFIPRRLFAVRSCSAVKSRDGKKGP